MAIRNVDEIIGQPVTQGAMFVEYVYNTSTSVNSPDTASFASGDQGALIGSITAALSRRVQFSSPILTGDDIVIEVSDDRVTWFDISGMFTDSGSNYSITPYTTDNAVTSGLGRKRKFSSTQVDVYFGQYATNQATTYGGAGPAWSAGGGGAYWRVKRTRFINGLNVGPGAQPEYYADNGSGDVVGPNGAVAPSLALGTGASSYDITMPDKSVNDLYIFEINYRGFGWVDANMWPFIVGPTSSNYVFGMRGFWVSANTFRVQFGNGGTTPDGVNGLTGAGTTAWSVEATNATRFRLRKASPTSPVGFGQATATTAGLISSYEEYDHVTNISGPFATGSITLRVVKVGRDVTINFPQFTLSGNNTTAQITFVTSLPARFFPDSNALTLYFYIGVISAGAAQTVPGSLGLSSSGALSITKDLVTAGFTASTSAQGFYGTSISYRSAT